MAGIGIRPLGADDPTRLGPYRLLWRLTTGGMGRLYLARSAADGPLVAVKTLLAEGFVSDIDRKRFAREVDLARRIDSEYTARVLDADPRASRPWMAIEYVPAPSLGDLVREAGPLPPEALPRVAAGTVQALIALHGKNVVHRDIKPQNILLPLTGPLVIDFGISHASDRTTTSLTLGTIDYTSPEQALGRHSTERSDVFSLGATLFHLAVGHPPYPQTDDGPLQRLARVQTNQIALEGLPAELAPLIRPCLSAEPRRRPKLDDLLVKLLEMADRASASARRNSEQPLPARWTALITAYEAHGRALSADRGGTTAMTDDHTCPLPPAPPTLLDTTEREARRERERQAREARERRERELRDLAEATRRAKAQKAERQRKEKERRQAEEARRRAEEERNRNQKKTSSAGAWALVALLVVAFGIWQPWKNSGDSSDRTSDASRRTSESPFRSSSGGNSSSGTTLGLGSGSSRSPGRSDTDRQSDTISGSGSDKERDEPAPKTSYRARDNAPDRKEEAFKAVSAGDCLPVYDTGRGGDAIAWSAEVPPKPVSCSSQWAGLMRVTSTAGSVCPSGVGKGSWTYSSSGSGRTTKLCVTRIYLKNYCLLGKQSGDSITIGPMTAVDCQAQRVPAAYNQVMHISGVYRAPAGANAGNCRQGTNDRTRYWAWLVNDDEVLLCTTVFRNS
ncbi:serine/threonine protein kinase [Streptomyces roseoverticillatus]|uniref:serine/threonine-protein kinase n=1 Tax=Streptomyces roseoverticillatus TaxID=66429 RepID=UPI001F2077AE|nr:serine/threonine-protein kinase [Streptomyces roseoverticillatus]MCF3102175.1 serine/threonine protein kinase [Streptomyces roseoverticillatus]